MADLPYYCHPSSEVEAGAQVGADTKIWRYCHVMKGAQIGRDCSLGQNVFVASGVKVGNHVKIQNNVSLYTGVEIESNVFIGPSCVFTNVINPRSEISRKSEYKKTKVNEGATLGANATIVCGNEVGRYAFVGAGAVVTRFVPDFALMKGVPARRSGWMCRCGEALSASTAERWVCSHCKARYVQTERGLKEDVG